MSTFLQMEVAGLALDPSGNSPILILKSQEGERTLPIWIGIMEAASIAMALQNVEFPRPMTHDLFKNFIALLGATMEKVMILDLKDATYFAQITFNTANGDPLVLDSRPSDAIALAIRTKAPIFVAEEVLDKSSSEQNSGEAADQSEEGKKWAEYLSTLNPDDFSKV